jgi:hypothetical protein
MNKLNSKKVLINWLQLVLGVVFAYSLALIFAGSFAGSLFSWFGFGPNDSNTRLIQYSFCYCSWRSTYLD